MEKETNLEHYLPRLARIVKEHYGTPRQIFYSIQKYMDPGIQRNHEDYTSAEAGLAQGKSVDMLTFMRSFKQL